MHFGTRDSVRDTVYGGLKNARGLQNASDKDRSVKLFLVFSGWLFLSLVETRYNYLQIKIIFYISEVLFPTKNGANAKKLFFSLKKIAKIGWNFRANH